MKEKIVNFFEKSVSSEIVLKRIAIYLFIICILLGLVFFKLNEINNNLVLVSEPILTSIKTEENKEVADVFIEEKGEIGDVLPLFDELEETSTSENTTVNHTESTTNKNENETKSDTTTEISTSKENTSLKIDFVINVNSKKVHYADCTFVNRMKEENKKNIQLNESELKHYLNNGYSLCSTCGG